MPAKFPRVPQEGAGAGVGVGMLKGGGVSFDWKLKNFKGEKFQSFKVA